MSRRIPAAAAVHRRRTRLDDVSDRRRRATPRRRLQPDGDPLPARQRRLPGRPRGRRGSLGAAARPAHAELWALGTLGFAGFNLLVYLGLRAPSRSRRP